MTGILTGESTAMLCAVSLAAGPVLGGFYDIFRIRRYAAREFAAVSQPKVRKLAEAVLIFTEDILFALVSAVIFSVIFYRFSYGAVRWYALAAAFVSFAAYRVTVGRLVMGIAGRIIALIRRITAFTVKVIKTALTTAKRILYRFIAAPVMRLITAARTAAVYPIYRRQSAQFTSQLTEDALTGFETANTTNRSKWIKQKTKPKNRRTRAE